MSQHQKKVRPLPDNKPYIDPNLLHCKNVWVRNSAPDGPLAPLYTGPYPVLHREEKYFIILHHHSGPTKTSVDKCKAAAIASEILTDNDFDDNHSTTQDSHSVITPHESDSDQSSDGDADSA